MDFEYEYKLNLYHFFTLDYDVANGDELIEDLLVIDGHSQVTYLNNYSQVEPPIDIIASSFGGSSLTMTLWSETSSGGSLSIR